jgi:predicted RNA-binding protein with PIN domain
VVSEAFPQLVEALHAGASTAASDPIDAAVVAYVVRPAGWPALVADAIARWSDERRDTSAGELDRLRNELAELRAQARAEPARVREEVTAALTGQAAELDQLRKTLRARTGELRAAERERDATQAAVDELRAAAGAADVAREAELKKLRTRVAELERTLEANRRGARTERDLDDARLRLLLDTVLDAAAGLRRELDLPSVAVRPADTVPAADGADGARTVADVAALDRLLDLPQAHLIVDGYNVTKSGYGDLPLVDQRTRLVTALAALQARAGTELTVAFDGSTKPPAAPRVPRGLRVLFSAPDETADDLIRRLVAAEPPGRPVVVVTSDREIVGDVRRSGAWTVPSAVLLARLG